MSTRSVYLALIALLANCTLGAPHDEDHNQTSTATDQLPSIGGSTTHVIITVTTTSYSTSVPPYETDNCTSEFAIPPSPGSVTAPSDGPDYSKPTSTAVILICPHLTELCITDGIPISPSGITSLVLPSFTYDPLPTSMASGSLPGADSTMVTDTLATSASPTSPMGKSTICLHTVSHIVPGNSSTDLPWTPELPWITHSRSVDTPSESLPTFSVLSSTAFAIVAWPLPTSIVSGSDTSKFYWLTRSATTTSSSATSSITSTGVESTAAMPAPNVSTTSDATATPTILSTISSAVSAHPRCKAKFTQAFDAKVPVKARNTETKATNISTNNSSILTLKTKYIIDASLFRGMNNATPSAGRDEESTATKRRINYWTRFFAVAEPPAARAVGQCLACDQEGEVTCLPGGKYTWCTDGCAVTLNLGCDMVCKEGVIRKEGNHCVQ